MYVKKRTKNPYFQGDNAIARCKDLSLSARGLYFYMWSLPEDWQFSFDRLSLGTGVGLKVIRRCVKELEKLGLLKREFETTNKGVIAHYTLEGELHTSELLPPKTLSSESAGVTNKESTNKESTKENIKQNSEPRVFKKEDFENLKTDKEIKDFINNLSKADKDRFLKEFLTYKQEFAKNLYEESNDKPSINLEMWIKYILSKDKALENKKRYCTLNTIEKDFKTLFKLQDLGYLEKRIDDAIEFGWQGIWFDSDARAYNRENFKPKYDPRKGSTGESVFSDNPDDYINPNTPGVKSVDGCIYEVDLWELTGRKQS